MDTNPKQHLKTLYQALRDKPLDPADPHDAQWYVPYVQQLESDPIAEILNEISFNDAESLHYVTGQRGTGKSTELLRLKKLLIEEGVVVFYIDMLRYLHMAEPAEISDFLIAVSAGLAEQARDHGFSLEEESYWQGLKAFIGRFELEKATFKSSLDLTPVKFGADISARLKADTTFKQRLQEAARGYTTELVQQVNDFVIVLVAGLRRKYKKPDLKVAVIIDSFEQIRGYYGNVDDVFKSVLRLFGTDGKHLRLPHTHTVITVPPYLSAASSLNLIPASLPSVHVRRYDNDQADESGINILTDIVFQRNEAATTIFTKEILRELAIASGGDLRDFFALVSNVLVKAGTQHAVAFPLDMELTRLAKEKLRRSLLPIDDRSTQWLYKVHCSKKTELTEQDQLSDLALLFDRNLVIHYQNGDNWYGIHPLITDYVLERQKELDEREAEQ